MLQKFRSCEAGNVGIVFGFALIPLVGAIGVAVDYGRAAALKAEMQKASDSAALTMVLADHQKRAANLREVLISQVQPGVTYTDLETSGSWIISGKRYRVVTTASLPTTFASVFTPQLTVSTVTAAELITQGVKVQLETASLEPEANDYNELRVYCYKPSTKERLGPIDTTTGQRLAFQKIADNSDEGIKDGVKHPGEILCGVGETLSIQMHNIRDARKDTNPYSRPYQYDYYTDTTEDGNTVKFNTNPAKMIETIYCPTKEQCTKTKSEGGMIPDRKENRDPAVNTAPCTSGYMYMGWEDRPPPGGDRDYDDIRVVMSCHSKGSTAQMMVRLVE